MRLFGRKPKEPLFLLVELLGFEPRDPELYDLAFRHSSVSKTDKEGFKLNNERLEFLGDSVLSLAIAEEVYRRYPDLPEGELVKLHHVVVSTVALAKVARDLDLGRYILLGKGEIHTGGADKDSILADTMEAIFGLTYLECGREAARDLVLRLIAPLLDDEKVLNSGRDWKTELLNLATARGWGDVRYEVTGEGPDHARVYTAVAIVANQQAGTGVGPSKKEAERLAAEQAYRVLV